jgi:hypothetical protein
MTGPAEGEYLDIVERATEAGVEEPITDALAVIRTRLRLEPREFGEPMYHLSGMRMEVRNASVRPLYIEYGVHDEQPVVVIRRVRWLDDPDTTA